jgi:hypothetical protein
MDSLRDINHGNLLETVRTPSLHRQTQLTYCPVYSDAQHLHGSQDSKLTTGSWCWCYYLTQLPLYLQIELEASVPPGSVYIAMYSKKRKSLLCGLSRRAC